jgi:heparosan-N-sulfate-glucuronate 5-epimerase
VLLSSYPVNIAYLITPAGAAFDASSIHRQENDKSNLANASPITIALHALASWNCFMEGQGADSRKKFLTLADWLIEHEQLVGNDIGGWPLVYFDTYTKREKLCISSSAQGLALSVLLRAYALTSQEVYLEVAQRAVRSYACDILDGGINTPIADQVIFFEVGV